ncbi:pectinesterase/pectinesterase inhibitor ppe8b [Fagus crenata]
MPDDTVGHDFQSWFDSLDWKLMQTDAILANITVASDGSGDFTSIMEAVQTTPNNSLACFVIYIKKATYKEYMSIPQNKWNIMMVGDDMDQTIILGSHSNTTSYAFGTRNLKFDLQGWLSGAITNLAICNDELVGTNMSTILKDKIIVSLEKVTTLVNDQWAFVLQMPNDTVGHGFQSWFDSHDWKLMQTDAILANITVASDGSGDFTSIMEAVRATPNNSLAHFVIYIKKAIYKEYVSIPQNKWNIMMLLMVNNL